jgi:hypothetical protein
VNWPGDEREGNWDERGFLCDEVQGGLERYANVAALRRGFLNSTGQPGS